MKDYVVLKNLGKNINIARVVNEFKQIDIAKYSGKTVGTLSKIEKGNSNLTLYTLYEISKSLNVDPEYLFIDPNINISRNHIASNFCQLIDKRMFLKIVGKNISLQRIIKDIKQKELASMCKKDLVFINKIEKGSGNITISTLNNIANSLNVDISVLFKTTNIKNFATTNNISY